VHDEHFVLMDKSMKIFEIIGPKYKYGNTQVLIPKDSDASEAIDKIRDMISDEDLAGDGKDIGGNHITVRYGLQSDDLDEIIFFLKEQPKFTVTLRATSYFPPSEHSDNAIPIIVPVDSDELHRIEAKIGKYGDFAKRSFPNYHPHATIAYVKPSKAKKYKGIDLSNGKSFLADTIAITNRNGDEFPIKLRGTNETK